MGTVGFIENHTSTEWGDEDKHSYGGTVQVAKTFSVTNSGSVYLLSNSKKGDYADRSYSGAANFANMSSVINLNSNSGMVAFEGNTVIPEGEIPNVSVPYDVTLNVHGGAIAGKEGAYALNINENKGGVSIANNKVSCEINDKDWNGQVHPEKY